MQITEVRVFPVDEEKLKAYASIVLDACFIINDLKIIEGKRGLFISMPSRRRKRGGYRDVAHPLNNETRRMIEECVLAEYQRALGEAGAAAAPGAARRRGAAGRGSGRRARTEARGRGSAPGRRGGARSRARPTASPSRTSRRPTCATRSGASASRRALRACATTLRLAVLASGAAGNRARRGPEACERCACEGSGASPSGKARDFGSRYRRFESSRPNHPSARDAVRI